MASFKKYGFENHRMEVLWTGMTSRSLLNVMEMQFIEELNACDQQNGLNVISYNSLAKRSYDRGYRNVVIEKPVRKKRIITQYDYDRMKTYNPVFDDEKRAIMVERLRSEDVRAKLRAHRATMVMKTGKEHHNSKPIDQFSVDGIFLRRWDCAADISRELGLIDCKISAVCKGKRNTHGGFVFKYASL